MPKFSKLFFGLYLLLLNGCASKKYKDVDYLTASNSSTKPSLTIFKPRNSQFKNNPVLLFVHGGNWNSGNKNWYGFLGRNFAKKGITTVLVGYNLSPIINCDSMAKQIAQSVKWTFKHISDYNGNPNKIFVTGHSAGGNLVALVATNPDYLPDQTIIKGVILNDAAGLDMKHYLEEFPPTATNNYLTTWTTNAEFWKKVSPIYFLNKSAPRFKIYTGGTKTYESIRISNQRFLDALQPFQPNAQLIVLNKKHVGMITQYFFPWSHRFDEIKDFMESNK